MIMQKVIDAEKFQECEKLLQESCKHYIEYEKQLKLSDEMLDKALEIAKKENFNITIITEKVIEVFKYGEFKKS